MAPLSELPVYPRLPLDIASSAGCELVLQDGRVVLDLYGGHCVNSLGASAPELGAAIAQQWNSVSFLSNLFEHQPRADFLTAFGALLPPGEWQAFLSNSGSEANENALKVALAATGRQRVIAFEGAFHGRTAAASAISDVALQPFPTAPLEVTRVAWGDLAACRAAADSSLAAIFLEPIQSMAGVRTPPAGFLEGLCDICDKVGAALCFDEVQTASGRTGTPLAATTYGVTPDIFTTAKGAAGGLPIGVTVISSALARDLPAGLLGSTFGGGPTVLAAATAVARAVASENFQAQVRASGEALAAAARRGPVREVRGAGLLLGLVMEEGLSAAELRSALLERGVLVGTSCDPSVARLFPALTLTVHQAQRFGDAMASL
ncbi:MAG TPA: aspartate aminotransferase family protein [Planctomycetes bacterium]|jgi:acetylornithine/succinyldiaminopimelate/putrescine aminotransferase|nr:aspartate aminotransferase family protein [Planctomycetota bacterium]HIL52507.1 aspartate aminotransferase family protein [Planctomycetota bacterium]